VGKSQDTTTPQSPFQHHPLPYFFVRRGGKFRDGRDIDCNLSYVGERGRFRLLQDLPFWDFCDEPNSSPRFRSPPISQILFPLGDHGRTALGTTISRHYGKQRRKAYRRIGFQPSFVDQKKPSPHKCKIGCGDPSDRFRTPSRTKKFARIEIERLVSPFSGECFFQSPRQGSGKGLPFS